jgi:serine phosphatase RsbU (regulator of sigma subunit)
MSRRHARVFREGDAWLVEDLGSRNGTTLNGRPVIEPSPVCSGDVIGVASTAVTVRLAGAQGAPEDHVASSAASVFVPAESILEQGRRLDGPSTAVDAGRLRRQAGRLRIVNEVHEALSRSMTVDDLLGLILDRVFKHLKPEFGAVYLETEGSVVCAASRSVPGGSDDVPESSSLIDEVIHKARAAVVTDLGTDDRFAEAPSMLDAGLRTLVAAPLLTPEGALGMIVLSSTRTDRRFTETDLELLVPLASAAALRIRNVELAEEAAQRHLYEREIELARRIQVALLPTELPTVPGYELLGGNTPSLGVSGDYYQVLHEQGSAVCHLLLADVAGKGLGAALITAYLDALCSCTLDAGLGPGPSFEDISRRLHRRTPVDRFATAFLGTLDPATGRLCYASAGHEPAIVVRSGGEVEWLGRTGLPLGLLPDASYETAETVLRSGDLLVLYSDGLSDASSPSEEVFGRDRLADLCREHRHQPLDVMAGAIDAALDDHVSGEPFGDDRTLVLTRRRDA